MESYTKMRLNMRPILLAEVHVEYEHRKNWHKRIVTMTCLTKSIIEFGKFPHSMDYVRKNLPSSKNHLRFRIRKIDVIKQIGNSFYYE